MKVTPDPAMIIAALDSSEIISSLRAAMLKNGISCQTEIIPDGELHRFKPEGRKNSDAWYCLHLDGIPAGSFGDWRAEQSFTWCAKSQSKMTQTECAEYTRHIEAQKQARDAEKKKIHGKARQEALKVWESAKPATADNPYLKRKQVQPHGVKVDEQGRLVVPARDANGTIHTIERITPDGVKRFLLGGAKQGNFFEIPGSTETVYIAEGFSTGATIHQATGHHTVCALDCGNLKPVAEVIREKHPNSKIILAADDDQWKPNNSGLTAARAAADAIGARMVSPKFKDISSKPTDFNDLAYLEGIDAVKKQLAEARHTIQPPIDLWSKNKGGGPFPVNAFPENIRAAILEYQAYGQQPLSLVACSALAALSLVCQGFADVGRDTALTGPLSLNLIILGVSGERKTASDKHFKTPISEWLELFRERSRAEVAESEAKHEAWAAKCKGLSESLKTATKAGKPTAKLEAEFKNLYQEKPQLKKMPEIFYGDTNPASLGADLSQGYPSASIWSDEAGSVVGGNGFQAETRLLFLSMLNKLWDGGGYRNSRRTTENIDIQGRRLSCSLMMQPAVIEELLSGQKGIARGIGMLARYLISYPISTIGQRPYKEPPDTWPMSKPFFRRIETLLNMPLPMDELGRLVLPILKLSTDAKQKWIKFHDAIEVELGPEGIFHEVPDFGAKIAENAARLSGLFHIFLHGATGSISSEVMESAARIALWFLRESKRVFGLIDQTQEERDAKTLLQWLIDREYQDKEIAPADLLRYGPNSLRKKQRRDGAVNLLRDNFWLIEFNETRTTYYRLNPEAGRCFNELS
ncbi:MAG: DUF3987 domain-containing protein [Desulfobacterales bacterium]|nr:DUF3987 domain-containing protein [Desulfobacterales bacterium]MDD4071664.1 DUF3987 domain-containing protein [Desulfobacterales bacterium]MDD4393575.1 DUF3987 domain-containing protein [Desulfobacterales bacterium]